MGHYFYITRGIVDRALSLRDERLRRRSRIRASAGKVTVSQKTLSLSLIAMLAIFSFLYLTLVNIRATKGFEIKRLEKRIVDLENSRSALERTAAELQSINQIEQRVNLSDFVPTTNVSYLNPTDYALVNEPGQTP
ncbi:MAG: hypothetical protein HY397_02475 [Candidatus Doudnabacteria bacterium]|nr:hypothetical protein [Candidatus Doudnabacteria bacterium]